MRKNYANVLPSATNRRNQSGCLEADKTLIMLRKFHHVSRYDGLLDASRAFSGFAVRDGNPRTHKSRLNCPLEK